MPDNAQFSVDSIAISDYATQDSDGKPLLAGMQTGATHFREVPSALPAWFLTAVIKPIAQTFSCSIVLDAPSGRNILRLNMDYEADILPPKENRLIVTSQLPSIPFPGVGDYTFRVLDVGGRTVFRHVMSLRVGKPQKPDVTINVKAEINKEFLHRDKATTSSNQES